MAQQSRPSSTPPQSTMIRQLWFGYLNGVDKLEGEKWYYRYHAPEFVRWYGAWLRRYETYNAIDPPPEAVQRYGARPGKYTEMWWPSLAEYKDSRSGSARPYTQGTWKLGSDAILTAMTVIPAWPTEIIAGNEVNHESRLVRWMRVFRYPEPISQEEGDRWYLQTHAEQTKNLPELLYYVSYKTVDFQTPRPQGPYRKWHRVDELWFADMNVWRKAVVESSPQYTAPSWAKNKGEPYMEMYSDFIRVKSDVDFLRDLPKAQLP